MDEDFEDGFVDVNDVVDKITMLEQEEEEDTYE